MQAQGHMYKDACVLLDKVIQSRMNTKPKKYTTKAQTKIENQEEFFNSPQHNWWNNGFYLEMYEQI